MFLKNFTYAFRNIRRDKFYSLLNGAGLAVGIAAALLIFLWANDEFLQDLLEGFAYRIDIGWGVFALAGLLAVIIAFLTVGAQSLKAALSNPVDAIRQD